MSRATRFLALAIPLTLLYLLALASIIPVPLLDPAKASLLLPVVSPSESSLRSRLMTSP